MTRRAGFWAWACLGTELRQRLPLGRHCRRKRAAKDEAGESEEGAAVPKKVRPKAEGAAAADAEQLPKPLRRAVATAAVAAAAVDHPSLPQAALAQGAPGASEHVL